MDVLIKINKWMNVQVSSRKGGPKNEVIMVDPLEAKRLAAKQMQEIKAKEKFKVKEIRCFVKYNPLVHKLLVGMNIF